MSTYVFILTGSPEKLLVEVEAPSTSAIHDLAAFHQDGEVAESSGG